VSDTVGGSGRGFGLVEGVEGAVHAAPGGGGRHLPSDVPDPSYFIRAFGSAGWG
jgi:hypothetical protein